MLKSKDIKKTPPQPQTFWLLTHLLTHSLTHSQVRSLKRPSPLKIQGLGNLRGQGEEKHIDLLMYDMAYLTKKW